MVVLGLILILLGVLVGGYTVMGGLPSEQGTDVSLSFLGLTVQTSAVVVFALGALTLLLLELGVLAMRSGARKSSKRRAELQRLRRVEAEVASRQSAEGQRNATATTAAAPAPAPFARRDTTGETGSQEAVRTDRPDSGDDLYRSSSSTAPDSRRDTSDVRPPEGGATATGATGENDVTDDTRRVDRA